MHSRRSDTPQHARAHNPARRLARAHFVLTHGRPTHSQIPTFGVDGRARIRHASRTPSARHCVASASTRRASGIQLRWRRSPQTPLSTATAARRSLVCATQLSYRCMPLGTRVLHCDGSDRLSGTQRVKSLWSKAQRARSAQWAARWTVHMFDRAVVLRAATLARCMLHAA